METEDLGTGEPDRIIEPNPVVLGYKSLVTISNVKVVGWCVCVGIDPTTTD